MKIKKDMPTVELIEALKLTFEVFYLPYLEKDTAQDIYDLRKAIFEELSRRNQEEFEKIPWQIGWICYNKDTPKEKGNDDND